MRTLRNYVVLLSLQARTLVHYRGDLLLQITAVGLQNAVWFFFIWLLFERLPHLGGWQLWDIILLYGTVSMQRGLLELLFEGIWELPNLARRGELDRLLIRPVSPIVHLFTLHIGLHGIGNLALGGFLVTQAFVHVDAAIGGWVVLYFPLVVISGALLLCAISLIGCSLCFWTRDLDNSIAFLTLRLADFTRFPLSLYPAALRNVLTYAVPFAFLAYVPVGFVLGHVGRGPGLAAPLCGLAAFALARAVFYTGLNRYHSTGS